MKNSLSSIEDCEWTKRELEFFFFHQIKFIVFKESSTKK